MKIQQKTEVLGNRVFCSYKYFRDHWYEWFWMFIEEGCAYPYFYLPVYRSNIRYGCYVMPTPLAPFGLILIALYFSFRSLWIDIVIMVGKWGSLKRVDEMRKDLLAKEIE
jgi:hypothetical protein